MRALQPAHWMRPRGYANGIAVDGVQIYVSGQIGWNAKCEFESDDFVLQTRQALANVLAVLREANAGPQHIARMTWYVTRKDEYLARGKEIGVVYRELMSAHGSVHYPAMSAVQVAALMEDRALVEIECTAVIPRG
ncbi:MAG: RidA family protein [Burkholderiaceae bacterium]